MRDTGTGIGRALRTARLRRGKSLEEASRETRVKAEYLQALERESFDVLLGDVYVRGFLRSYSRYLGLNPEKVVSTYERLYGRTSATHAPVRRAADVGEQSVIEAPEAQRRTAWPLAAVAALIALISAGAIGILARSTPPLPRATPSAGALADALPPVQVDMLAEAPVTATAIVDGEVRLNDPLEPGEARSFEARRRIEIRFEPGNTVRLVVNGTNLGTPGRPGHTYERSFVPSDFRRQGSEERGP